MVREKTEGRAVYCPALRFYALYGVAALRAARLIFIGVAALRFAGSLFLGGFPF
jgi:hypothetical protein